jgi:hypothetical protein
MSLACAFGRALATDRSCVSPTTPSSLGPRVSHPAETRKVLVEIVQRACSQANAGRIPKHGAPVSRKDPSSSLSAGSLSRFTEIELGL